MDEFETFEPEAFVSRLLGLGDVKGLMGKLTDIMPEQQQEEMMNQLAEGASAGKIADERRSPAFVVYYGSGVFRCTVSAIILEGVLVYRICISNGVFAKSAQGASCLRGPTREAEGCGYHGCIVKSGNVLTRVAGYSPEDSFLFTTAESVYRWNIRRECFRIHRNKLPQDPTISLATFCCVHNRLRNYLAVHLNLFNLFCVVVPADFFYLPGLQLFGCDLKRMLLESLE